MKDTIQFKIIAKFDSSDVKQLKAYQIIDEALDKIRDECGESLVGLEMYYTTRPRMNPFCPKRGEKLKDWLYDIDCASPAAEKLFSKRVVQEFDGCYHRFPGQHKNVNFWVVLETGHAVGFNESPTLGWSFPVVSLKNKDPLLYKWARSQRL